MTAIIGFTCFDRLRIKLEQKGSSRFLDKAFKGEL
jgi:hypothetical protein